MRGAILPVTDLRARLRLGVAEVDRSSVVVVVQVEQRQLGLLVDAVCDIIQVTEGLIQPTPDVGGGDECEFVNGVMSMDEGIISLLRLEAIAPPAIAEAA